MSIWNGRDGGAMITIDLTKATPVRERRVASDLHKLAKTCGNVKILLVDGEHTSLTTIAEASHAFLVHSTMRLFKNEEFTRPDSQLN